MSDITRVERECPMCGHTDFIIVDELIAIEAERDRLKATIQRYLDENGLCDVEDCPTCAHIRMFQDALKEES